MSCAPCTLDGRMNLTPQGAGGTRSLFARQTKRQGMCGFFAFPSKHRECSQRRLLFPQNSVLSGRESSIFFRTRVKPQSNSGVLSLASRRGKQSP